MLIPIHTLINLIYPYIGEYEGNRVVFCVEQNSSRSVIPYDLFEKCIERGIVTTVDESTNFAHSKGYLELFHCVEKDIVQVLFNPTGIEYWVLDICLDDYSDDIHR